MKLRQVNIEKAVNELKEKQTAFEKALRYQELRGLSRTYTAQRVTQLINDQTIDPVLTNHGGLPMNFPYTVSELTNLTDDEVKELLVQYELFDTYSRYTSQDSRTKKILGVISWVALL